MRIAIITASLNGGAGIAALRLHESFQQMGLDSILVNKKHHEPAKHVYSSDRLLNDNPIMRFLRKIRRKRVFYNYVLPFVKTDISFSLFSVPFSENRLHKLKILEDVDVINLHWTSGYIDLPSFLRETKVPIFFTLHDTNYFTAGCHYFNACNHFETNCVNCPIIVPEAQKKLSDIFNIKKEIYNNKKHFVIGISDWIGAAAKRSSLMKDLEVRSIPNSFSPVVPSTHEILDYLRGSDKIKALVIAQHLNDKRKGWAYIEDIMANNTFPSIEWIVVGDGAIPSRDNCTGLGTISSEHVLASIYSSVDFLVHPAIQDNFPNTVVESLSYGTPVVAFKTSGLVNMINSDNGFLANNIDKDSFIEAIGHLLSNLSGYNRNDIMKNALEKFSPEMQAKSYINFFEKALLND